MGEKKDQGHAGAFGWMLDLLSVTQLVVEADSHERMSRIANRIKNDTILNDAHRDLLRRIFKAKWQELEDAPTPQEPPAGDQG